jgi:hypothetical protein
LEATRSRCFRAWEKPLIRYLKEVRPASSCRELFLTMRVPYRHHKWHALAGGRPATSTTGALNQTSRTAFAAARLRDPPD